MCIWRISGIQTVGLLQTTTFRLALNINPLKHIQNETLLY